MDDQDDSSELSGWAWYEMGRMAAARSQLVDRNRELVWRIFSPRPNYDAAVELQKANENILAWMAHSEELQNSIVSRDAQITRLQTQITELQERLALAMKCYESVSTDSSERLVKIQALEDLIETLRKGDA